MSNMFSYGLAIALMPGILASLEVLQGVPATAPSLEASFWVYKGFSLGLMCDNSMIDF
jgi:hypothetical protein